MVVTVTVIVILRHVILVIVFVRVFVIVNQAELIVPVNERMMIKKTVITATLSVSVTVITLTVSCFPQQLELIVPRHCLNAQHVPLNDWRSK